MKITGVKASIHAASSSAPLLAGRIEDYHEGPPRPFVVCRVTTDEGLTGYGFTGRFLARHVADTLEAAIQPVVDSLDPRDPDAVRTRVREALNPRCMTGVIASAASALDIALWDIRGQASGRSIAQMLGGSRKSVPVYLTFGMPQYDRDLLADAARLAVEAGYRILKMVVAVDPGGWREDARRIHAVSDAVGDEIELIIDANESFDPEEARLLARAVRDCRIAWFEEPIAGNDPVGLARLRSDTGMLIGAGQMEADPRIFSALLEHDSVDVLQPNVLYCGGFTRGAAIARLAQAKDLPIANGAGWALVNMHLMAGAENGWLLEHHVAQTGIAETIFTDPPCPVDGYLAIPDKPGLGLTINLDGLSESEL
jgi:L-alanine-DL-glutamate epimerase-like enolase superfamily enzyme